MIKIDAIIKTYDLIWTVVEFTKYQEPGQTKGGVCSEIIKILVIAYFKK